MRSRRPAWFLGVAGTFLLLAAGLLVVAMLGAQAALEGAVISPVDPDNDQVWADLAPGTIESRYLEAVAGLTREQVVSALGAPVRVRRDSRSCDDCSERYIYAFDVGAGRVPIAVCFSDNGIASGTCGGSLGDMTFDRGAMSDRPEEMVFAWPFIVGLALPLSLIRARVLRRWRTTPLSIK